MTFSLIAWIKGWDAMGHPITVNFRGNDSHQTLCGAMLTIAVKALTLVFAANALFELLAMKEPSITFNETTLLVEEQQQLSPIVFDDYEFIMAMSIQIDNDPALIPAEMGRLAMFVSQGKNTVP